MLQYYNISIDERFLNKFILTIQLVKHIILQNEILLSLNVNLQSRVYILFYHSNFFVFLYLIYIFFFSTLKLPLPTQNHFGYSTFKRQTFELRMVNGVERAQMTRKSKLYHQTLSFFFFFFHVYVFIHPVEVLHLNYSYF